MPPDREVGDRLGGLGMSPVNLMSPLISKLRIVDDPRDYPMTTSNQALQEGSNFEDSSGQLFSIYFKAAEEDEDNKMVEP
jgi:hypothetical protein